MSDSLVVGAPSIGVVEHTLSSSKPRGMLAVLLFSPGRQDKYIQKFRGQGWDWRVPNGCIGNGHEWLAKHVDCRYTGRLPWAEASEAAAGKNFRPSLERIGMR